MRQIGNYTVEDIPIGSGGMGQVLRGTSADGLRPVAIKEILPTFVSDVEYRSRIEGEINFLKKLDNDNVVKVYDHFEMDGNLYIVMELVEGLNVEQYVAQRGPIAWREAVKYMLKLLDTMQYVHEHGIVHRDIKPGNIMIRDNGDICLLDFGVAKDLSKNTSGGGTVFGTVIGTDGYMSPEQAEGMSIDHRSDIYALGCVLYFMLTGSHAFGGKVSELEMQEAISRGRFPRLADKVKGLPASLQEVLDHAVDKNMMRRFQSCREFAGQLARTLPGGTQINTAVNGDVVSVSVGRENCDICVGPDNYKVSRHHADIRLKKFTGGEFYVYTDCSSNGTLIDGRMLRKGMSYNIPKGENPEILLAGDPACRLDMGEVAVALDRQVSAAREYEKRVSQSDLRRHERSGSIGERRDKAVSPGVDTSDSLLGAVKACFRKYALFSGRASRAEFWWFYLFNVMVSTAFMLLFFVFDMKPEVLVCLGIYSLASFLPSLAVTVRRLHDVDKGWVQVLLILIPVAGTFFAIYLLVLLARKGDPGVNRYGNPTMLPPGFETVNMRPRDPLSSMY